MKIAVASQDKKSVTGHAGHCQKFWIYQTQDKEICNKQLLELPKEKSFHNSFPRENHPLDDVKVLIAGGMGQGLVRRLEAKGIEGIVTKETDPDRAVAAYLDGSLITENADCHEGQEHHHHHHHHHGKGHQESAEHCHCH